LTISIDSAETLNPWILLIVVTRLAGLPPTLGFYAKIQVISELVKVKITTLIVFLLIISAINLFAYLRATLPRIMIAPAKRQKNKEKNRNWVPLIVLLNILPLLTITL
jgi:NADH:ubiquinone oxidoreductase subunit 2 (subunit N)